jgi:leader peptidase (prepilin peptidase) / N-methyltransferase
MMLYYWLFMVFVVGVTVGSFLNVCIARMPLEKSILWPGSRCGSCYESIRWYDNLPLISYLWLGGKCRRCQAGFSSQYLWVELFTGVGFAALFYVEVALNIHEFPLRRNRFGPEWGFYPWEWWAVWIHHAILFSFLVAASACDLAGREIPLPLTLTGTMIGLIGSVLLPWPWPWLKAEALPQIPQGMTAAVAWQMPGNGLKFGAYAWPVWGPLPSWLDACDWKLGLVTGLTGMLAGTFMLRGVAFVFKQGLGRDALGLGDADLMMMAGAFLGWQPMIAAFFLSVAPALVIGIVTLIVKKDNELPFGPSLAGGILGSCLLWGWIGPHVQILFFWPTVMLCLVLAGGFFMLFSSYLMRILRRR